MTDSIIIQSEALIVSISSKGAELQLIRDQACRDYLWYGDPKWWASRAPLLFPIVGGLKENTYSLDGERYTLPRHGFARHQTFSVLRQTKIAVTFRLTDNEETRAVYPFAFCLDVTYVLDGASLEMRVDVTNTGDAAMPASFGFHPAFTWPLPGATGRDGHVLLFDRDEPEAISVLDKAGLISAHPRQTPVVGNRLMLEDAIFEDDALIWKSLNSRRLTYRAPSSAVLDVDFPDMPSLGIWTKPGAPYLCIEPWQGFADEVGYDGDLWDKPGIVIIEPEKSRCFSMTVAITPPPQSA